MYLFKCFGYLIIGDVMFWNADFPTFNFENPVRKLDVAIIGGGLTGLSTAYYLRNSSLKVAVFEQSRYISKIRR